MAYKHEAHGQKWLEAVTCIPGVLGKLEITYEKDLCFLFGSSEEQMQISSFMD